jgi:hypothetical protein
MSGDHRHGKEALDRHRLWAHEVAREGGLHRCLIAGLDGAAQHGGRGVLNASAHLWKLLRHWLAGGSHLGTAVRWVD